MIKCQTQSENDKGRINLKEQQLNEVRPHGGCFFLFVLFFLLVGFVFKCGALVQNNDLYLVQI